MAAPTQTLRKFVISFLVVLFLLIGVWSYCMLGAPAPVSGFTQKASLDVAHACGIHCFDAPVQQGADGAGPAKVTDLPEGCYIYTGERPSQSAPRWVVVNPGGTITWLDIPAAPPKMPVSTASTASAAESASAAGDNEPKSTKAKAGAKPSGDSHYETYDYPRVKWQAKPLDGKGAIAQLSTTYDKPSPNADGVVKYRLTLFKAPHRNVCRITLLDDGGFKIMEFKAGDFQDVPGTQLMEARDSFPIQESLYRQVRDYAVN